MHRTSFLLALALAVVCRTAAGAELRGTTVVSAIESSGQSVVYWVPSRRDANAPDPGVAHIFAPGTGTEQVIAPETGTQNALTPGTGGADVISPETGAKDAFAPVIGAGLVPIPAAKPRLRQQPPREAICGIIEQAAEEHELPIDFLARLIWQESRFKVTAVSHAGAQGIAQFMPATAAEWKLKDPFDPQQAVWAAASLLRSLKERFGNLGLAAAAYNAGPGRVAAWLKKKGGLPAETRNYVSTITGRPASSWVASTKQSLGFVNDQTADTGCLTTVAEVALRG